VFAHRTPITSYSGSRGVSVSCRKG
jgi:hypothetical protein